MSEKKKVNKKKLGKKENYKNGIPLTENKKFFSLC